MLSEKKLGIYIHIFMKCNIEFVMICRSVMLTQNLHEFELVKVQNFFYLLHNLCSI